MAYFWRWFYVVCPLENGSFDWFEDQSHQIYYKESFIKPVQNECIQHNEISTKSSKTYIVLVGQDHKQDKTTLFPTLIQGFFFLRLFVNAKVKRSPGKELALFPLLLSWCYIISKEALGTIFSMKVCFRIISLGLRNYFIARSATPYHFY